MLPYINIGDIQLPFFSIGFSITCLIFILLSFRSLRSSGLDENSALYIPATICIGSILFSKIPLALIYKMSLSEVFKFWSTGHTLVGGLLISTLIVLIYSLVKKISFIDIIAALIYPSFFALSSYRFLVCFMVGCCYGFESDRFGVWFHPEAFAGGGKEFKLFPTQIAESIMFFIAGLITLKIRNWKKEKAVILALILLITERFIAEMIRADIKEKVIKVKGFGLSIWFFSLVAILLITDIYLNLIKYWVSEIKDGLINLKRVLRNT